MHDAIDIKNIDHGSVTESKYIPTITTSFPINLFTTILFLVNL